MGLTLHPVPGKAKAKMLCEAFAQGAPKNATGHVFYGVNETNVDVWDKVRALEEDWYYIDGSYFDKVRGQQFRITKNRVQIDPRNLYSNGKRFKALNIEIKPWRTVGEEILVVHQSPSFMKCVAKASPEWWNGSGKTAVHRHWGRDKSKMQTAFIAALKNTSLLGTHSSAAAVTATIEGVTCRVSSMSALHDMENREHTLHVLADNQFSINEMKDGTAWAMLPK